METKNYIHLCYAFLFGMLGALFVLIVSHAMSQPTRQIGTVNITGIINQFIKEESKKSLSPDVLKEEVNHFGKKLEVNLKQFAHQKQLVLLPSEAVIAGSTDYTAIIGKKMQKLSTEDKSND